jgi:hypothetical protein
MSLALKATLIAVINPGQGTAPPGVDGPVTTIIGWAAWVVFALAVVGILVVAGSMIISHRNGRGGEHGAGLAYVLGGTILAAAASGIIGAVV